MAKNALLELYLKPKERWPMSAADNIWGMSLPEYHQDDPKIPDSYDLDLSDPYEDNWLEQAQEALADLAFSAEDMPTGRNSTDMSLPSMQSAFNQFMGLKSDKDTLTRAQKAMFQGAALKTVAAAGDLFTRLTSMAMGQRGIIKKQASNAIQNYQNQMDALDNQVLYLKNQLSDRFNKTIETNIMNLAAKNLRVTAGNALELSKEEAQEITEDMRMSESNSRLKKIALEAGKASAQESSKYAIRQMWAGLISSATKLGIMYETGGGTGQSWGDLYKGYRNALANQNKG